MVGVERGEVCATLLGDPCKPPRSDLFREPGPPCEALENKCGRPVQTRCTVPGELAPPVNPGVQQPKRNNRTLANKATPTGNAGKDFDARHPDIGTVAVIPLPVIIDCVHMP